MREGLRILFSRYIRRALYTQGALAIEQKLHNRFWEWRFKAQTYGLQDTDIADGTRYEPTPYLLLTEIFNRLELNDQDVYVDLGCGKGRSLLVAAQRNIRKIVGVEYDKDLLAIARSNLARLARIKPTLELIYGMAQSFDFSEVTCIFLYNPFGAETLTQVLEHIAVSLRSNPRPFRLAYANPQHDHVLAALPWLEQFDMWEEKFYPDFIVYPPQPRAVSFWRFNQSEDCWVSQQQLSEQQLALPKAV